MSALAEVLARLAHDVRAPLGLTTSALGELELSLNEDQRELLRLASKGLRRLERLSERLGLAAELERLVAANAAFRVDRQSCDGVALVLAGCERAGALEARRGVVLEMDSDIPPTLALTADAPRLILALAELVGNAWRHARSRIVVRVRDAAGLEVTIEDDGDGVAEAALPWLFTRFEAGAGRAAGNLGLSLARALARAHSGEVVLLPTRPTRFQLHVPR